MEAVDSIDSVLKLKGRQFWSVPPTATVYEAIERMSEKGVGALLVMIDGKLLGMISERDYARKVILKDRSSRHTLVREIMTSPVLTVTSRHNVEECMRLMTENHIRHLPVVDSEQVVGVISIGDLVNWIITVHGTNHRPFAELYRWQLSGVARSFTAEASTDSRHAVHPAASALRLFPAASASTEFPASHWTLKHWSRLFAENRLRRTPTEQRLVCEWLQELMHSNNPADTSRSSNLPQRNAQVPSGVEPGNQSMSIAINGAMSNSVLLPLQ